MDVEHQRIKDLEDKFGFMMETRKVDIEIAAHLIYRLSLNVLH